MFKRLLKKDSSSPSATVQHDSTEKQQGFLCPMCMEALPGPGELQAHFEKAHNEGGGEQGDDDSEMIDQSAERSSDELLSSISKGSLEISLHSNSSDIDKEVMLLQQELSDISVDLKEEKWYTAQLKAELDKITAERDKLEEEKGLISKEFTSQLRSAEEGYFEIVQENQKLKEDLVFADYNVAKDRNEKLKQQAISAEKVAEEAREMRGTFEKENELLKDSMVSLQKENEEEQKLRMKLEDDNKALRAELESSHLEMDEEKLRKEALESGVDMLKRQISSQQIDVDEEKKRRITLEKEEKILREQKEKLECEREKLQSLVEEKNNKNTLQLTYIKELETNINEERSKIAAMEKEHSEQLNKMEGGDKEFVIHELNLEKGKLLEKITSMENSMTLKSKEHSEEVESLMQEKAARADEMREMQGKQKKLIEEIESKDQQIENIQSEFSESKKEKEKIEERIRETENHVTKLKEELQGFQEEHKRVKEELQCASDDKESLSAHLQETQQQCDNTKAELEKKQKENESFIEEIRRSEEESERNAKKLLDIEKDKSKIEEELQEIVEGKAKMATNLADIEQVKRKMMDELLGKQDEVKALEKVVTDNEQEIQSYKDEISNLNSKVNKLTSQIMDSEALLTQKDEAISSLKMNENKLSESIKVMECKMEDERGNHVSLMDTVQQERSKIEENLRDIIGGLEQQVKSSGEQISELTTKIASYEEKRVTLESVLQQKDDILNDVQTKLEIAEQELKKPCEGCKNYEVQLCKLQEETKDSREVISSLRKQFEDFSSNAEEEKKEATLSITQLQKEREDLETSCIESVSKISEMEVVITALNSEKDLFVESALQAEDRISKLDNKKSDLEKEISDLKVDLLSTINANEEISNELKIKEENWINERNTLIQEAEDHSLNIQKITTDFKLLEENWKEEKQKILYEKEDLSLILTKECEAHQMTKDESKKVEECLHLNVADLKKQLVESKQNNKKTERSKEELQHKLNEVEEELCNHVKEISEYEKKVVCMNKEKDELRGDVTVLEVQLQSSNEEKSALLERLLTTEEQHKKSKQKLSEYSRKLDQSYSALQELGQENQNMQVQQVVKSNRQWIPDSDATYCKSCDKPFSMTVRKHHCRHCGLIFCKECSCYSAVVAASKKPVRVCEPCSVELSSLRGSNVRRLSNSSTISSVSAR